MTKLTPELMLHAYAGGIFPMAETPDSEELYWFDPHKRAVLSLDGFHVSRSLRKIVRQQVFDVRINSAFDDVIRGCATTRENTWINGQITDIFTQLHRQGFAHSVEAWQDGKLVGGLYGAAIGGAFFGESMFSLVSNASKCCLVHLVARLRANGFTLLDVQYRNDHLTQFGLVELTRERYRRKLENALASGAIFYHGGEEEVLVKGWGITLAPPVTKGGNESTVA